MKKEVVKQKGERTEALVRLLVCIVCGAVLYVWSILAMVLVVFGWLYALLFGIRNRWVAELNEYYAAAVHDTFSYLSGLTNQRPFPFAAIKPTAKFS